jgi:hypothetical protein
MTQKKKVTPKVEIKKTINKKNAIKPFAVVLLISIIFVLILPYLKESEVYTDTTIGLNKLEKNFSEGKYKKILIDENKAFAVYSGT